MSLDAESTAALLRALDFAAKQHRDQRRKGLEASPYINHPIQVARLLAETAGVTDLVTLQAAILHDTVEDTRTSPEELQARFGADVCRVVEEVTDDKRLPKEERRRLQIERAPKVSVRARLIKIADKIANVMDVADAPPHGWTLDRRREYIDWAERVVNGCLGSNAALEACWLEALARARTSLETPPAQTAERS